MPHTRSPIAAALRWPIYPRRMRLGRALARIEKRDQLAALVCRQGVLGAADSDFDGAAADEFADLGERQLSGERGDGVVATEERWHRAFEGHRLTFGKKINARPHARPVCAHVVGDQHVHVEVALAAGRGIALDIGCQFQIDERAHATEFRQAYGRLVVSRILEAVVLALEVVRGRDAGRDDQGECVGNHSAHGCSP